MLNKQDYINAIYQDIDMVKGDTLAFNFDIQGLKGVAPTIVFTCSEHYNDDEPLFTASTDNDGIEIAAYNAVKNITTFSLWIDPIKTKDLDLARYYYDIELKLGDDVITLMRGRLTLVYEVTR